MKKILSTMVAALFVMCGCTSNEAQQGSAPTDCQPPHLEKRGNVTQLIVKNKPWLALAGELGNSTSSSREYLAPHWQRMKEAG